MQEQLHNHSLAVLHSRINQGFRERPSANKSLKPTRLRGIFIVHSLRSLLHNKNTATAVGLAWR
jgi:hypothetical protein